MTSAARLLLAIMTLNGSANSLSNIFINVYLYKVSNEVYLVLLFHLISFLCWLPAFAAAGWLGKRSDRRIGIMIGNIFLIAFFGLLLVFGERITDMLPLAGLLYGTGLGFYWMSVNVLMIDVTDKHNRSWFNGLNGTLGSVSQMIIPLVGGFFISSLPGMVGYGLVFAFAVLLFSLSVILASRLRTTARKEIFHWRKMIDIHRIPQWRTLSYCFTALHFRDDVLASFLWIWMYMVTQNEGVMGGYSFLLTGLSSLAFFFIGRFGNQKHHLRYALMGAIGFSLSLLSLLVDLNEWTLLIYAVLAGMCNPLFQVPFNTLLLNSIAQYDGNGRFRVELIIAREVAISIGRITSTAGLAAILYVLPESTLAMNMYLFLLIVVGFVPVLLLRKNK